MKMIAYRQLKIQAISELDFSCILIFGVNQQVKEKAFFQAEKSGG